MKTIKFDIVAEESGEEFVVTCDTDGEILSASLNSTALDCYIPVTNQFLGTPKLVEAVKEQYKEWDYERKLFEAPDEETW